MKSLRVRTAVLALGEFVNTGLSALLAVVLTRLLTKEAFGTYRQVLFVYALFSAFLASHIAESLLYFLPRASPEDRPRWLGQTIQLSLASGAAIALLLFATAGPWASFSGNPRLPGLLRWFALFAVADRVVRVVVPGLIAVDRPEKAAMFTVASGIVKIASVIVPAACGGSLETIFFTMSGSWVALAAAGSILVSRDCGLRVATPRRGELLEQAAYVAPLLCGWTVAMLQEQFGQFVATGLLSTADYAEYAVGAAQLPLVGIWTGSIASALMPDLVRLASQHRYSELLALWHRGVRKGAVVIFPVAATALLVPDLLVRALYGPAYGKAAIPFVFFLLTIPLRITNYGVTVRAMGRTHAILIWSAVGLAVNVVATLAIVGLGRGTSLAFAGPAVGFLIGYAATVAMALFLLARWFRVSLSGLLPWKALGSLALLSAACAIPAMLVRLLPVSDWVESASRRGTAESPLASSVAAGTVCILVATVLLGLYVSLGMAFRVFDERERGLIRKLLLISPRQPRNEDSS